MSVSQFERSRSASEQRLVRGRAPSSMREEDFDVKQHEFLDAAKEGDYTLAARLVQECPKLINGQPKGRWAALFHAIFMANTNAVRFFLMFGADVKLKTDREDQEHMTPLELAAKLKGVPEELPDYLLDNEWPESAEDRAKMYKEIQTLLQTNARQPRDEAISHSYMVAMSDGTLDDDAVKELQSQWLLLDPTMSLIDDVTERINEQYDAAMLNFIDKLDFPILQSIILWTLQWSPLKKLIDELPILNKSNPTLGDLLCWPFRVDPQDVRHALDDLNPPDDSEAGWLTLKLLAFTIPAWGQGATRAAFQWVAIKRFLQSFRNPCKQQAQPKSPLKRLNTLPLAAAEKHVVDGFTLYATVATCTLFAFLTDVYSLFEFFIVAFTVISPWHGFRAKVWALLWELLLVWLGGVARAYCEAMQPRIPMLTVRLHRQMQRRGRLTEQDYTVWRGAKPYEVFDKTHGHSD